MSFPRYPKYKSSGVEWLGDVPQHWTPKRLQRCVFVVEGQVDPECGDFAELPLIAPNHVESGTGRLLELESATEQGAESGKYLCQAGDVVYSKIRPALRKACIAPRECLCSADMYPLRAHSGLTNPYLLWVILSEQFSSLAVLESQRVAMPKINRESLKEVVLAVPPEVEQQAIVAFLDRETAKIDALVAEQERLIELLKEKRQGVISHAVTKGLNPSAPMKDSGIEWVGHVPAHWPCYRNKVVFKEVDERSDSDEGELLTVSHITGVTPRSEKEVNMFLAETLEGYKRCKKGDLVINTMWAWMGALGTSPCDGLVSPAYNVYRLRGEEEVLLPAYYDLLCRIPSHRTAMKANSTGVWESRLRLYPDAFLTMMLPVPPLVEQRAIVENLEAHLSKSDALVAQAQNAVDLLRERRTALISAAVTGQIDVRPDSMRTAA